MIENTSSFLTQAATNISDGSAKAVFIFHLWVKHWLEGTIPVHCPEITTYNKSTQQMSGLRRPAGDVAYLSTGTKHFLMSYNKVRPSRKSKRVSIT